LYKVDMVCAFPVVQQGISLPCSSGNAAPCTRMSACTKAVLLLLLLLLLLVLLAGAPGRQVCQHVCHSAVSTGA
jgi:hypothetical protein